MAQYAAGGLFQWVSYGFCMEKSLLQQGNGKSIKKQADKEVGECWREGLAMFSMAEGLQTDIEEAFNRVK
jgi:hypothetical protein